MCPAWFSNQMRVLPGHHCLSTCWACWTHRHLLHPFLRNFAGLLLLRSVLLETLSTLGIYTCVHTRCCTVQRLGSLFLSFLSFVLFFSFSLSPSVSLSLFCSRFLVLSLALSLAFSLFLSSLLVAAVDHTLITLSLQSHHRSLRWQVHSKQHPTALSQS